MTEDMRIDCILDFKLHGISFSLIPCSLGYEVYYQKACKFHYIGTYKRKQDIIENLRERYSRYIEPWDLWD